MYVFAPLGSLARIWKPFHMQGIFHFLIQQYCAASNPTKHQAHKLNLIPQALDPSLSWLDRDYRCFGLSEEHLCDVEGAGSLEGSVDAVEGHRLLDEGQEHINFQEGIGRTAYTTGDEK